MFLIQLKWSHLPEQIRGEGEGVPARTQAHVQAAERQTATVYLEPSMDSGGKAGLSELWVRTRRGSRGVQRQRPGRVMAPTVPADFLMPSRRGARLEAAGGQRPQQGAGQIEAKMVAMASGRGQQREEGCRDDGGAEEDLTLDTRGNSCC